MRQPARVHENPNALQLLFAFALESCFTSLDSPFRNKMMRMFGQRSSKAAVVWCQISISLAVSVLSLLQAANSGAAVLSDPEVDRYNVRVGTQTFAGLYQFTGNTLLVETAQAIRGLGSDTIKMYLAPDFPRQYRITLGPNITNLLTLARDEPSCRAVFNMPFQHYIAWIYPFGSWWPFDGYSASERADEYREVYDLTRYFLTNFNNSGKTFYLGHWEGDGYLCPNANWSSNPTPTMLQGFIDCLNNRQKAVDDAKRDTAFTNVNVFCYAEANRVRDAMANQPGSNLRMINAVVPYVTNLDYLSYSSYDAQNLSRADLYATLDYMEAHLPANKAAAIPGQRIWIGEYGWGYLAPDQQEPNTRAYIQRLLNYGTKKFPFILFWEIYNNEPGNQFCLVDSNNVKVASWYLHQRFINNARLLAARFKEANHRLPNDVEFGALVTPMLDAPLPPLEPLSISNVTSTLLSPALAQAQGRLTQGIYGADGASVRIYWGPQDGGTSQNLWADWQDLGINTNFNPASYSAMLTNLVPNTTYYFRFYATNSSGDAWAPDSGTLSTQALNPADYRYRMAIRFSGYNGTESVASFPALVNLSPALPGFSYQQFASATGGDLRFTDAGGLTPIPFEIDEWNPGGTSRVWVRVPSLSGTNTTIWAYWGNSQAPNLPASSTNGTVWAADHILVWHLKENALPFADSARRHPAIAGITPLSTTGEIGRGASFDGGSRYLDAGSVSLGDTFTLSAWVKLDPTAANIQTIWANKPGGWDSDGLALYVNSYNTSDQQLRLETGDGTGGATANTATGSVSYNQWHFVAAAVNRTAGTARLYVDGVDRTEGNSVQPGFANAADLNLGRFVDSSFYMKGVLDEARIETGCRSADWLRACWLNITYGLFATYSQVNPRPKLSASLSAGEPLLSWPADAGQFALYFATNLLPPIAWLPFTNSPEYVDGNWQIQLPLAGTNSENLFFRLEQ